MKNNRPKQIKIDKELFDAIVDFMECIDYRSVYSNGLEEKYDYIISALERKINAIEARKAYGGILGAKDENERNMRRIEYLKRKNNLL